jgi:hypothetical protein
VLFWRAITDVAGRPPLNRGNGGAPIDYSGRAVLRREHCYMIPESLNSGVSRNAVEMSIASQRLGKRVLEALTMHAGLGTKNDCGGEVQH